MKTLADLPEIMARAARPRGPSRVARIMEGTDQRYRWEALDGLPLPGLDDDPAGFGRWASAMAHAVSIGFVVVAGHNRYRIGSYLETA